MSGPFGVYVHFPYCRQRCPYCDFAVSVRREVPHGRYTGAILAELHDRAPLFAGRRAVSVYFGGGTPSLWRPAQLAEVRAAVLAAFPPPDGTAPEVTLEADPKDLDEATLAALRAAGVTRLSLGVQSLRDRRLVELGRQHSAAEARRAIAAARAAGFDNLSVDLMIGLPGQPRRELQGDLDGLLALAPEHVSLYQLTVEPGTALSAAVRAGRVRMPDGERQAAAYEQVQAALAQGGYRQYEISSWARDFGADGIGGRDLRAVHNRLYWTLDEYLGLGVSAHSLRLRPGGEGGGGRFANERGTERHLAKRWDGPRPPAADDRLAQHEALGAAALGREALWLGLRLLEGISLAAFAALHGYDPRARHGAEIERLVQRGLLILDGDALRLSAKGVLFADEVGAALL